MARREPLRDGDVEAINRKILSTKRRQDRPRPLKGRQIFDGDDVICYDSDAKGRVTVYRDEDD